MPDNLHAENARLQEALKGALESLRTGYGRADAVNAAEAALSADPGEAARRLKKEQQEAAAKAVFDNDYSDMKRLGMVATTPGEWREEQRRAAQIEVLEGLTCECSYEFRGETESMSPAELELNTVLVYHCPRCRALAALKGGRG